MLSGTERQIDRATLTCQGSLIQALGFSLLEEESRGKDGRLINCGTWDAWTILDG